MKTLHTNFLQGGGKTGAIIREYDWSVTPLGSTDTWSLGLLIALSNLLNSKVPSLLFWGENHRVFYNDSYYTFPDGNEPSPVYLGTSAAYGWPDEWPELKALLDQVLTSGEGTSSTDVVLPLWPDQPLPHQRWMFNYSPVCDEYGIATGVVVTCTEILHSTQINLTAESSQNVQAINQRYRMILDSLPANIAILDKTGEIISINERWLSFSLGNNGAITGYIGVNYLDVCRHSNEIEALRLADGIEEVLAGHITEFRLDYPCHSPSEERWFRAYVNPVYVQGKITEVVVTHLDITNRKIAEKIVQKALREKQKILDASLDIICALDVEGRFIQVSRACRDVWGYDRKELVGTRYIDLVHEDDKDLTLEAASRIMSGETMRNFENRYRCKDGSVVPILWSARWDPDENVMFCVARDATEKKQAEEQVLAYSQKITNTLESITDGFFILDNEWRVTYWNNKAEYLLKMPRIDVLGKSIWDVYREAMPLKFYSEYKRAVIEQVSVHFEEYLPSLSMWFDVSAYPSEDGLSVYFKDITHRKQADDQIRIAKERYDIVTRATHDAIWDWDLGTNALNWGDGYRILFGYDILEEIAFGDDCVRIHPEDKEALTLSIKQAIESPEEEQWKAVYRFLKADDTYATVLDRGFIIRNQEGTPIRMIGAMQDITLQKQREEEREQLISELTKTNYDLRQFSYITTHNFRAPLSNLIGLLNMMNGYTFDDPILIEIIEGFRTSTVALNDTINDLINILIIKGNPSITREYVKLRDVFNKVYNQIRIPIEEADARIHFDDQEAPLVLFDRTYIESIVMNLLTNSLKFRSASRKLQITIKSQKQEDKVRLHFQDNGIGLDLKRYGNRLFGLNQRFHDRPDSKGLGLYLIKSQIESLGGTIQVESQVEVGTTFIITF